MAPGVSAENRRTRGGAAVSPNSTQTAWKRAGRSVRKLPRFGKVLSGTFGSELKLIAGTFFSDGRLRAVVYRYTWLPSVRLAVRCLALRGPLSACLLE